MTDTNTPDIICEFPWLLSVVWSSGHHTGPGLLSRLGGDIAEIAGWLQSGHFLWRQSQPTNLTKRQPLQLR